MVSKYENLIFYQTCYCMAAILAAILEKKVDEDVRDVGQILQKNNCVKIQEFNFL